MWTLFPVVILVAIGAFVFYELPGIANVPSAAGGRAARGTGDRPPVLLAVRVPERRDRDRHDARAGGRAGAAGGRGPRRRRHPLVVDPGAREGRSTRSRDRERDLVRGRGAGRLHRASAPSSAASSTRRCSPRSRSCPRPSSTRGSRSAVPGRAGDLGARRGDLGEGVCAKCHGLAGEGGVGRRLVGSPILADPRGARERRRNGRARRGQMPAVGSGWTSEQMDALIATSRRTRPVAVSAAPAPVPAWQRGKVASWLVTTDHKRIGILYIATSLVFFVLAGLMAMAMRLQLAQANADLLGPERYNELVTIHGTAMVFLVVVPILAGFGNYLVPLMIGARDVAFPRLNALSYWLFAPRRRRAHALLLRRGRRGDVGLDVVPAAVRRGGRERPGPVDPLAAHPHRVVARRRDQLHRHDPQHADARHDVDADAALRLVDLHLRVAAHGGAPDPLRRAHAAAPRPRHLDRALGGADELLRPGGRRRSGPLPARVLVLRAPRGLHHGAARVRDRLRGAARLRPQADLRLQGGRVLDGRDRLLLDARLGAPHVHGRPPELAERVLHGRLDDHRRARPA